MAVAHRLDLLTAGPLRVSEVSHGSMPCHAHGIHPGK